MWYNGNEIDIDYGGDGSKSINIGIKHLKLSDRCILKDWDVSQILHLTLINI